MKHVFQCIATNTSTKTVIFYFLNVFSSFELVYFDMFNISAAPITVAPISDVAAAYYSCYEKNSKSITPYEV